jgi:hypothetical protein
MNLGSCDDYGTYSAVWQGSTTHEKGGTPDLGGYWICWGRPELSLTGSGLRYTQHSPLDLNLTLNLAPTVS